MNNLSSLNQIDQGVKKGEISGGGMLDLPLKGEAILFDIDVFTRNNNQFLAFYLTLPGAHDYRRFDIRCPSGNDKQAAQYLGMQRIYATLFGAVKADPKSQLVDAVYNQAAEMLKANSIKVAYALSERSFISQRDGTEKKMMDLDSLSGTAKIERVGVNITKPSEEATAPAATASAGWGTPASGSEFGNNPVPF